MKLFKLRDIHKALKYAQEGGQALHVWEGSWPNAPACFRRSRLWAHLFDYDEDRLKATAKRLGVKRVVVSRKGVKGQHVDLCGKPLEKAIKECD